MPENGLSCDLHVHSVHSGPTDVPFLGRFGNECYSAPEDVYEAARERGMTLFTLTDHDSIEGALRLASRPDVFISEELTLELQGGRQLHLGVYGLDERQHAALQARRRDAEATFAYLAEERLPAAVNHLFSALTGRREDADVRRALQNLDLVETRNAMMPQSTNEFARLAARRARLRTVGGSDAHTLASVARAYTLVPGARDRAEYLGGLRRGLAIPVGRHGSYARLTADIARILAGSYAWNAERALVEPAAALRFGAMLLALPFVALLPLVTAGVWAKEVAFGYRHYRRFAGALPGRLNAGFGSGPLGPATPAARVA
jgi:predicted metal-dependent phosphoesterase TrpH